MQQDILEPKIKTQTLNVIRRNGSITPFDIKKIKLAITKAFLDVEGNNANKSSAIHTTVDSVSSEVEKIIKKRYLKEGTVHIEEIQDKVELVLMRNGEQKVARSYVLYREEHRKIREAKLQTSHRLTIKNEKGLLEPLDEQKLERIVQKACKDLENVNYKLIVEDTIKNLYNGATVADIQKALLMSTRIFIEQEPNYSFVAARILLHNYSKEVFKALHVAEDELENVYRECFKKAIISGIEYDLLSKDLLNFDLEVLANALNLDRDLNFSYLSLQTLYDRYFLHINGNRFELPQVFFMRVAMGLAIEEENKNEKAIEFYNLLSSFDYMTSTPTLFNSGTKRSQLSSCFLSTVPDDLNGIYNAIKDNALLAKFAGGLGNDWTPVRAMNAHIKGTNGKSQGVVPFLKVANDTTVAVNQGGKRKGALCCYLETWHLDIEEFLELKKNTGDERRRTHDMNTANWIPDLFMERVMEKQDWTLFSPEETPDLHDLYGIAFKEAYENYEKLAEEGKIKNFKKISAVSLWRKMLSMLFETGHPWVTFKDPCNIRSPQSHVGVVHSSNLCTEITLNTSEEEIAVCNLGSINLTKHVTKDGINTEKLEKTIDTAIRMLDNVIDINYYSVPQARRSNLKHRPIGIGIMGFQEVLYTLGYQYDSEETVEFADKLMEHISYYAISASMKLAKERGAYGSFEGSFWSRGIMPIDSVKLLKDSRKEEYCTQDTSYTLDWDSLREKVKIHGVRNSNITSIAPTATIGNICNTTASIEPTFKNLFVKSNLSGEFTIVNPYLVNDLKELNLWDSAMLHDLKYFNGSVQKIDRIPKKLKAKYKTAFEIDPTWLIKSAARRQKWIDQSQSLNLYIKEPSGKKLDLVYKEAWTSGLKTTYYLRTLGASDAEKSTINRSTLNAVNSEPIGKVCSIDDPECESCQ